MSYCKYYDSINEKFLAEAKRRGFCFGLFFILNN